MKRILTIPSLVDVRPTELLDRVRKAAAAARRSARFFALFMSALLGIALFWSFWPTLGTMAHKWSHNPQYSHGYVVPFFALIVLWSRWQLLTNEAMEPSWWGIPILALGSVLRLAGAYLYLEWLDQAALLPCVAGLVLLVGGRAAWRWSWPAVLFLFFMLPLPYQLEVALAHPLQALATLSSTYAMQTLGLPALSEGNIIMLEDVKIGVYEACSGLGMLVTFVALSAAVVCVIRRPLVDKIVIFLSAVPIAVLMNIIRITVTGVLHHTVGSRVANVVFHDLAGWLMMPLALGVLWLELKLLAHAIIRSEPTDAVPVVFLSSDLAPRTPPVDVKRESLAAVS